MNCRNNQFRVATNHRQSDKRHAHATHCSVFLPGHFVVTLFPVLICLLGPDIAHKEALIINVDRQSPDM